MLWTPSESSHTRSTKVKTKNEASPCRLIPSLPNSSCNDCPVFFFTSHGSLAACHREPTRRITKQSVLDVYSYFCLSNDWNKAATAATYPTGCETCGRSTTSLVLWIGLHCTGTQQRLLLLRTRVAESYSNLPNSLLGCLLYSDVVLPVHHRRGFAWQRVSMLHVAGRRVPTLIQLPWQKTRPILRVMLLNGIIVVLRIPACQLQSVGSSNNRIAKRVNHSVYL